jgi:glyoxylase-like metal-dependent hydrolase (beta-lactamase superfamily II)
MGRTVLVEPAAALDALGVHSEAVRLVVVTHLHYDHIGNLQLFPQAELIVARADLEFWSGPMASRGQFAPLVVESEIAVVRRAAADGRVRFVEETLEVASGLTAVRVGGHSPGQLVLVVDTTDGPCVLASDAIHYLEELERDRPFALFTELSDMYRGYDALRALADDGRRPIIPGHDPMIAERFPAVTGAGGLAFRLAPLHQEASTCE